MSTDIPEVITLPSGAELRLQMAPFSVGMKLLKTIARELRAVNVDISASPETLKGILGADVPVGLIKDAVLQVAQSDAVEAVLGECLGRCLYEGRAIDAKTTFEPSAARGDYLVVAWEVMKFNLLPFFKGLSSRLSLPASPGGDSPR